MINNQPNGLNINNNAGSTHIEGLQKFVVEKGLDVGFAYDGDIEVSCRRFDRPSFSDYTNRTNNNLCACIFCKNMYKDKID